MIRKRTRDFRLRVIGGLDGSYAVYGATGLHVQIEEILDPPHKGERRSFTFAGAGLSVGLKLGATGPSDWIPFKTYQPYYVEDFEGVGGILVLPSGTLIAVGGSFGVSLMFLGTGTRVHFPADVGYMYGLGATAISYFAGWWEMH